MSAPKLELDTKRREFRLNQKLVPLPPKAFSVLSYLVSNQDRMIPKRELLDAFWPSNCTETALLKSISLIRKAFRDSGLNDDSIKTHHGLGYRYVGNADTAPSDNTESPHSLDITEKRLVSILSVLFTWDEEKALTSNIDSSDLLNASLQTAKALVEQYHGQLLRITIDGFTAAFGLEKSFEDVARHATLCAHTLLLTLTNRKEFAPITMSAAIDTGATILSSDNNRWRLPGDVERNAVKLNQQRSAGDIVLTKNTLDQLRHDVDVEALESGFKLLSAPLQRTSIAGRLNNNPSTFVGRRAEFAFLNEHLHSAMDGCGQSVMLKGQAGIGKTRLVNEFLSKNLSAECRYVALQCLPILSNTSLAPIQTLCETLLNLEPLFYIEGDVDEALLRELRGQSVGFEATLANLSDHERRLKSYALLDQLLTITCSNKLLVLLVEDVHWLDTTSKEYLNNIIHHIEKKRLLLIVTSRPVQSGLSIDATIELSPLNKNDCHNLLRNTNIGNSLEANTADILIERAGGNPFFLEELTLATQSGNDPNGPPPETVQAVIAARIASLPKPVRTVLYMLSVIGPPAPQDLLSYLHGNPIAELKGQLDELINAGFLVEEAGSYQFRHMLINETAYSMIATPDRMRLHSQVAGYLEKHTDLATTRPEILAKHHQEAGQTKKAVEYFAAAARAALRRSTHQDAVTLCQRGLALLDGKTKADQSRVLELLLMQASALTTLKGFADANAGQAYLEARKINGVVGSVKSRIRVLVGLWVHDWVRGNLNQSLTHANQLMAIAQQSQQPALMLQAHAGIGQLHLHLGELNTALEHLRIGLSYITDNPPATLPEQNAAVSCAAYAAWTASLLGKTDEAREFFQRSQILSRVHTNPYAESIHCALCSEHLMLEGDIDGCLSIATKAITISREHHFNFWLGTALVMAGWAQARQGKAQAASAATKEGIEIFEATGAGVQLANWYGLKAETLLLAHQYKSALDAALTALRHAYACDDLFFAPRVHIVTSHLYQHLGSQPDADEHAIKAQQLCHRFGMDQRILDLQL
ncbi:AAA family ATPase [Aurantivibrio plasticivorans]